MNMMYVYMASDAPAPMHLSLGSLLALLVSFKHGGLRTLLVRTPDGRLPRLRT